MAVGDGTTLNARYIARTVTVAAGVAASAAMSTPVALGSVRLESVEILIPAGAAFLAGVRLEYSGQAILPWESPTALVTGDNETLPFEIGLDVDSPVVVRGVNPDVFQHTFGLRFKVRERSEVPARPVLTLVPTTLIDRSA